MQLRCMAMAEAIVTARVAARVTTTANARAMAIQELCLMSTVNATLELQQKAELWLLTAKAGVTECYP